MAKTTMTTKTKAEYDYAMAKTTTHGDDDRSKDDGEDVSGNNNNSNNNVNIIIKAYPTEYATASQTMTIQKTATIPVRIMSRMLEAIIILILI